MYHFLRCVIRVLGGEYMYTSSNKSFSRTLDCFTEKRKQDHETVRQWTDMFLRTIDNMSPYATWTYYYACSRPRVVSWLLTRTAIKQDKTIKHRTDHVHASGGEKSGGWYWTQRGRAVLLNMYFRLKFDDCTQIVCLCMTVCNWFKCLSNKWSVNDVRNSVAESNYHRSSCRRGVLSKLWSQTDWEYRRYVLQSMRSWSSFNVSWNVRGYGYFTIGNLPTTCQGTRWTEVFLYGGGVMYVHFKIARLLRSEVHI